MKVGINFVSSYETSFFSRCHCAVGVTHVMLRHFWIDGFGCVCLVVIRDLFDGTKVI